MVSANPFASPTSSVLGSSLRSFTIARRITSLSSANNTLIDNHPPVAGRPAFITDVLLDTNGMLLCRLTYRPCQQLHPEKKQNGPGTLIYFLDRVATKAFCR